MSVPLVLFIIAACYAAGLLVFTGSIPSLRANTGVIAITRRHFHISRWLVGSAFLQWLTGNFFVIAAAGLLGPVAVGAIKACQNLVGVTHVFFHAAENVVPAWAAKTYQSEGPTGLQSLVKRLMVLGGAGTAAVGLVMAVPAREWLTFLFGPSFAEYSLVVSGFAISYLLMALAIPVRFALLAMEQSKPLFTGYILASAFTLIAAYPLISVFGVYGAVGGIIFTQAIRLANSSSGFALALRRLPESNAH